MKYTITIDAVYSWAEFLGWEYRVVTDRNEMIGNGTVYWKWAAKRKARKIARDHARTGNALPSKKPNPDHYEEEYTPCHHTSTRRTPRSAGTLGPATWGGSWPPGLMTDHPPVPYLPTHTTQGGETVGWLPLSS